VFVGNEAAEEWVVPVVAHLPGRNGTFWTSSVALWNAQSAISQIDLEYLPESTDNSNGGIRAASFYLAGYATVVLEDVLQRVFGIANGKGTLVVRGTRPISVTARVWTRGENGGTIGNGVTAVPSGALRSGQIVLPGVRTRQGFRTNVGVVTGDAWATVQLGLFDADGVLLAERFLGVPPRALKQLSVERLFGDDVADPDPVGSLVVTSGEEFLAYLTVIDGSSQDPVFVMPR
jgi:hypothetical protein